MECRISSGSSLLVLTYIFLARTVDIIKHVLTIFKLQGFDWKHHAYTISFLITNNNILYTIMETCGTVEQMFISLNYSTNGRHIIIFTFSKQAFNESLEFCNRSKPREL